MSEADAERACALREQEARSKARYRAKHAEQERERAARYRAAHREQERERAARWRAENYDRMRATRSRYHATHRDAILANHRRYASNPANRMHRVVNSARMRAGNAGLDFDPGLLAVLMAAPPTHCRCCGVRLDYGAGRGRNDRDASPSLDRVDNTRGYLLDNVAIICWRCNAIKGFASLAELETVITYMKRHYSNSTRGEWT